MKLCGHSQPSKLVCLLIHGRNQGHNMSCRVCCTRGGLTFVKVAIRKSMLEDYDMGGRGAQTLLGFCQRDVPI